MSAHGHRSKIDGLVVDAELGFPTLTPDVRPVSTGKWYYELELLTAGGLVQFGWAQASYKPQQAGEGVGDAQYTWAISSKALWTEGEPEELTRSEWRARDVIGTSLDLGEGEVQYYLNGKRINIKQTGVYELVGGLAPMLSVDYDESVRVRVHPSELRYLPKGFSALDTSTDTAAAPTTKAPLYPVTADPSPALKRPDFEVTVSETGTLDVILSLPGVTGMGSIDLEMTEDNGLHLIVPGRYELTTDLPGNWDTSTASCKFSSKKQRLRLSLHPANT